MVNESITDDFVRDHFIQDKFNKKVKIERQISKNPRIQKLLINASKKGNAHGRPDFIISFNELKDFLIVIECKADTNKHESLNRDKFSDFAVDGTLLYSSYLSKEYNILSIAVSGETKKEMKISTFLQVKEGDARDLDIGSLLSIKDYIIKYREDPIKEKVALSNLMDFSKSLHNQLRDYAKLSEAEKPLLISAILIALEDDSFRSSYTKKKNSKSLSKSLLSSVKEYLENANIEENKRQNIIYPYEFIIHHPELIKENSNVLLNLIKEIELNVKPFLNTYNHFDVLGRFYGEFLRYSGGDKKGLGIVLTPNHITELFSELIDVKKDDVVLDNCCGTGGFLISAMKKMIKDANGNNEEIQKIKNKGLIGIEQQSNMFALGSSNMILRGDGKANMYLGSCFDLIDIIKRKHKCTVGFLNPPYSQKGEGLSELEFIMNNLEALEKNSKCIAIVPMSCAIKQNRFKEKILENHTLEAVMSMPDELFYPVGTVTCIMIFKAKVPHDSSVKTWFGYWKEDGFVKIKNEGRVDKNDNWIKIKEEFLENYRDKEQIPGKCIKANVTSKDEWCAEAYMETDYSDLDESDFEKEIKEFLLYKELELK